MFVVEIPAAPTNLRVTGTNSGSIAVAWDAPTYDGGSPLTGYLVETCRTGLSIWSKPSYAPAEKLDYVIDGLSDGEHYFVRVFAENDLGVSRRSADLLEAVCAKKPTSKIMEFLAQFSFVAAEPIGRSRYSAKGATSCGGSRYSARGTTSCGGSRHSARGGQI